MPNLEANTKREYQPAAQAGETQAIAAGETSLAFDLYPAYRQDSTGNFAFSVLDVSQSLAMLAAGASGGTLSALLETSRAGLLEDRLHPAWDSFLLDLTNRHQAARLVASAAHWGQGTSQDHAGAHYLFESLFLDTLARNYGAELAAVDFTATPGNNQILSDAIHPWLAAHTQGRITYLASALGQNTRLVSASAWSLDGAWKTPPDASPAPEGRFELLDGTHVLTPMLGFSGEFAYAEGDGYRAFELPMAASDLALWVLMPEHDRFAKFRLAFSPDQMNGILAAMTPARKTLYLPKLAISSGLPDGAFATLNGGGAFTEGQADFSRINGEGYLYLDSLRHQTVVSLDEGAVKAAGATLTVHLGSKDEPDSVWSSHGSVVTTTPNFCDPVPHYDPSLALARPFLFAIRDQITGAILLMGQSTHPGGSPAAPDWTTDPCGFQIAPLGASPGLGG